MRKSPAVMVLGGRAFETALAASHSEQEIREKVAAAHAQSDWMDEVVEVEISKASISTYRGRSIARLIVAAESRSLVMSEGDRELLINPITADRVAGYVVAGRENMQLQNLPRDDLGEVTVGSSIIEIAMRGGGHGVPDALLGDHPLVGQKISLGPVDLIRQRVR
jgi:hypothetical protein